MKKPYFIEISGASANNLKNLDLKIPKNKLTVVAGVSGSGKSSIVYDTIYKESQRLYFSNFPAWTKTANRFSHPQVKKISGIDATIAIDQKAAIQNLRSTVGTFSGIYDLLRLLFSRFGDYPENFKDHPEFFNSSGTLSRSLFSFNNPLGQCPECRGYGEEDFIDPELIVDDWNRSIRERSLKITAPNGYIIYSQVTLDVLDSVCREHGFTVDTPLKDLSQEQLNTLFYGSERIKVPFGKHTLESRMKWTGIKAKPREEGYYRGFINVMLEILKRDRNKNILRFATSRNCSHCGGTRLRKEAGEVSYYGFNISQLCDIDLYELISFFMSISSDGPQKELVNEIISISQNLINIGLGYLKLSRPSSTLSSGEIQRIKISALLRSTLTGITFILDEPTVGLHRSEAQKVTDLLKKLRDRGNTVIIVEHDVDTILQADHIVETGPVGGVDGGKILFNGDINDFLNRKDFSDSPTWVAIQKEKTIGKNEVSHSSFEIKKTGVVFREKAVNTITGLGGSGKRTLLKTLQCQLDEKKIKNVFINRTPIGKTPRSNPATYTGISENIRDIFSKLEKSKELGLSKSSFSFNTKGGRCHVCEGAGIIETGMKHFGAVRSTCEICGGKRFNDEVLTVKYRNLSISDIYDLSINQASTFFSDQPKILKILNSMKDLGIGYLKLGQPSSTLSGGEAQRVKLAAQLSKGNKGTFFLFEEPTTGLHPEDVDKLTMTLKTLVNSGNTVVAVEHDPDFIVFSDHIVELSGKPQNNFKNMVFQGTVAELADTETSTGVVVADYISGKRHQTDIDMQIKTSDFIELKGVCTNNLKNVDISIQKGVFNVITGVSGSGKSSLAFDTLFSTAMNSFLEGFSPYFRSLFKTPESSALKTSGLMAPISVSEKFITAGPRSTAGTASGIWEILRMLFSRTGKLDDGSDCGFTSGDFSFNNVDGACHVCEGKGTTQAADIEKIITDPDKSFAEGALLGTTPGKYFGDKNGQFIHTLETACRELGLDISKPVNKLDKKTLAVALNGVKDQEFHVVWNYSRGNRTGTHEFTGSWPGFIHLFTDEYFKSIGNKNESKLYSLMKEVPCSSCNGNRLKNELLDVNIGNKKVRDIAKMTISELLDFADLTKFDGKDGAVSDLLFSELVPMLKTLDDLGLSHLTLNRSVSSLSLGERERLKLVKLKKSSLTNILYIVDEPSRGIHPADSEKIVELLKSLCEKGNTVVAVEHEPSVIKKADTIIDMGPGAGKDGGRVIFSGSFPQLVLSSTPTAQIFKSQPALKKTFEHKVIEFTHPGILNLKNISCSIVKGGLNIVTGVSGSGKTTLLKEVIYKKLKDFDVIFHENTTSSGGNNSTVGSLTKIKDTVKKLISRSSGINDLWKNSICKNCKGTGSLSIPLEHLADPVLDCPDCEGSGFNSHVLNAEFQGKNIVDILSMSVAEAENFFDDKKLTDMLRSLSKCGLGYLKLDQSVRSLSTGERQRLTLAADIARKNSNDTFFLFDEPSTGLHFNDINGLLTLFEDLNKKGVTIICAEHRMQIVSQADHVIDLGPGSGKNGGRIIFEGSVPDLLDSETETGIALKEFLEME